MTFHVGWEEVVNRLRLIQVTGTSRLSCQAHVLRLQPLQEWWHLLCQLGDLLLPLSCWLWGQGLPPW